MVTCTEKFNKNLLNFSTVRPIKYQKIYFESLDTVAGVSSLFAAIVLNFFGKSVGGSGKSSTFAAG